MTVVAPSATNDAKGIINSALAKYGLASLSNWAWTKYTKGESLDQIFLEITDRPEYKTRFPAMETLAKNGHAITEAQYISMEQQYAQIFHAAGLPPGFYDKPEDFATLFENNMSPNEVQSRVTNGFAAVANAPQAVRDEFSKFYGVSGDAAMAAYFLDPEKAEPALEQQVAAATIGGTGVQFGINTSLATATQLAQQGTTTAQAQSGFGTLSHEAGLFNENVSENQDLDISKTGVQAQFGLDASSYQELQRRIQSRQAAFQGSGGALATQKGALGLGEAGQP